tara:strand:- start:269 stop:547 length:279 start_codon:yes stop_codon:yes gene_type:complete
VKSNFYHITLVILLFTASSHLNAQDIQTDSTKKLTTQSQELDTEESIKYVSNSLWFELKKRLHLTSEEEEKKQQKEKSKKLVLNIAGIRIEN